MSPHDVRRRFERMSDDDTSTDSIDGGRRHLTTGELAVLIVTAVVVFGLFVVGAEVVRRLTLGLVGDRTFEWGLPSQTLVNSYLLALVSVLAAASAVNARRVLQAEGGWSQDAFVSLAVSLAGLAGAGLLVLRLLG
jgi:hypothetical protein